MGRKPKNPIVKCGKCGQPSYLREVPTRNTRDGNDRYRYYEYWVHIETKEGQPKKHYKGRVKEQTGDIYHESGDFIDLSQRISDEDFNEFLYFYRKSKEIVARNEKQKTMTRELISNEDLKELLILDARRKNWMAKMKKNQKTVTNPFKPITNERLNELLNSPNDAMPIIAEHGLNVDQIKLLSDAQKRQYFEGNEKILKQTKRHIDQVKYDFKKDMKLRGVDLGNGLRRKQRQ